MCNVFAGSLQESNAAFPGMGDGNKGTALQRVAFHAFDLHNLCMFQEKRLSRELLKN
jgi:hypothetical protein